VSLIGLEISLTQQQMHELEFFQPTNRKELIIRKQRASPSPNPNIIPSWMCPKTIANRRSDIPQRTEIKIKTKTPKRNQTSTHTYLDHLSATKRGKKREGESCLFPSQLVRSLNRIKFVGPKNNNETHLTLPLSSSVSPSDDQIRRGTERDLSTSGLSLSRRIDRVGLKLKLFFILITMAHHDRSIYELVIALAEEGGLSASTAGELYGVPKFTARAWLRKYRRDGQVGRRGGTGL